MNQCFTTLRPVESTIGEGNTYMDSQHGKPGRLWTATIPALMQIGYINRYMERLLSYRYRFVRHSHDCGVPHHRVCHVPLPWHTTLARSVSIKCGKRHFHGHLCRWEIYATQCVNESCHIDNSVRKDSVINLLPAFGQFGWSTATYSDINIFRRHWQSSLQSLFWGRMLNETFSACKNWAPNTVSP